jgi:hypothetical protein
MSKVLTLVHPDATLQVPSRLLVTKCDLFVDDPGLAALPYDLKSRVPVSDFREFVSALEGRTVKVTNNNFKGLSELCDEFRFRDLSAQLSQFRESGDFKEDAVLLSVLEERMQQHDREIEVLHAELSRWLQLQASLEQRIRTEAESASRRTSEVEKQVAEVRSEVETLRNVLREVRELAEGAQKKTASTEAWLEAEVSARRTTPAMPGLAQLGAELLAVSGMHPGWRSVIVPDFPKLFKDFKRRKFALLWRGSRDGFCARDFHNRCDRHPNTLTVILEVNGNIFGGFTPVGWESSGKLKADPSLKSFLFTLNNPHNVPARRFALKAERKDWAILCSSDWGPNFGEIRVSDICNANTNSYAGAFGDNYTNNTGRDGKTFFTGSSTFKVKEIEVFEIMD